MEFECLAAENNTTSSACSQSALLVLINFTFYEYHDRVHIIKLVDIIHTQQVKLDKTSK